MGNNKGLFVFAQSLSAKELDKVLVFITDSSWSSLPIERICRGIGLDFPYYAIVKDMKEFQKIAEKKKEEIFLILTGDYRCLTPRGTQSIRRLVSYLPR